MQRNTASRNLNSGSLALDPTLSAGLLNLQEILNSKLSAFKSLKGSLK